MENFTVKRLLLLRISIKVQILLLLVCYSRHDSGHKERHVSPGLTGSDGVDCV